MCTLRTIRIWGCAILFCAALSILGCEDRQPAKPAPKTRPGPTTTSASLPIAGKKVLLVHSYHAEYPWVDGITRGVRTALRDSGTQFEIHYMDTKRHPDEAFMIRAGELACEKIAQFRPDVVITADDAAQEYFAKKYVGQPLPFVFCGVNADPSKYGFPAANITGVLERCQFLPTIHYFQELRPNTKKIAFLSCDDSTSVGVVAHIKQQPPEIEITEYRLTNDFDEWREMIRKCNTTVDAVLIYNYHTLREKNRPTSMAPEVVMQWTRENATVPVIGVMSFTVRDGALAGVVESAFEHGEKAAVYALRILRGTPPQALPIVVADVGEKMINRKQAARFSVQLSPELIKGALLVPED